MWNKLDVKDLIGDIEELRAAEKRAALGKRSKKEVAQFEYDLGYNICKLSAEIKNGTYKTSPYHTFYVYEPKLREIQALKFRDRIVQNCICNVVLRPFLEPRLIYDNAACRKNKGTHFAQSRLTKFMSEFYGKHGTNGYFLKIDVAKYFNSIDHGALKKRMLRMPEENRELVFGLIDSYEYSPGKGLPMGNQSSQWFALYYLDGVDRLIKEKYRIKYYTRYMDDLVVIHHDREYLKQVLFGVREYAENELKLRFNSKTQISPLSQGVDYLGFHFYLTHSGKVVRRLRTSAKKRLQSNIKRLKWQYANDRISHADLHDRLISYRAHLSYGHTYSLCRKYIYGTRFMRHR